MSKTIKVSALTKENFAQFGEIISREVKTSDASDANFSWWDGLSHFNQIGKVSVNILEAKKRAMVIDKLEVHEETPELVVPMNGKGVVFAVAPKGQLDESQIAAFYLEAGKGVMLDVGVRHFIPYPVEADTDCLIVFKDATGDNDLVFEDLSDTYQLDASGIL